jgi:hypothetical protein
MGGDFVQGGLPSFHRQPRYLGRPHPPIHTFTRTHIHIDNKPQCPPTCINAVPNSVRVPVASFSSSSRLLSLLARAACACVVVVVVVVVVVCFGEGDERRELGCVYGMCVWCLGYIFRQTHTNTHTHTPLYIHTSLSICIYLYLVLSPIGVFRPAQLSHLVQQLRLAGGRCLVFVIACLCVFLCVRERER